MNEILVRQAQINDIEEVVNLKVEGWKTAYRGIINNSYLDKISFDNELVNFKNKYDIKSIIVAEQNKNVIGFLRFVTYDNQEYDCEIREIYVNSNMKRMGIGTKLFNYICKYFRENNKKTMILGVFSENMKARNFYEKMGGIIVAEEKFIIDEISYNIIKYKFEI